MNWTRDFCCVPSMVLIGTRVLRWLLLQSVQYLITVHQNCTWLEHLWIQIRVEDQKIGPILIQIDNRDPISHSHGLVLVENSHYHSLQLCTRDTRRFRAGCVAIHTVTKIIPDDWWYESIILLSTCVISLPGLVWVTLLIGAYHTHSLSGGPNSLT